MASMTTHSNRVDDPEETPRHSRVPRKRTYTLAELRKEPATLSVRDAARYLGISEAWCRELVRRGDVPSTQLASRHRRVITDALLAMLSRSA
jgi:excisionase family DNA binding protein